MVKTNQLNNNLRKENELERKVDVLLEKIEELRKDVQFLKGKYEPMINQK